MPQPWTEMIPLKYPLFLKDLHHYFPALTSSHPRKEMAACTINNQLWQSYVWYSCMLQNGLWRSWWFAVELFDYDSLYDATLVSILELENKISKKLQETGRWITVTIGLYNDKALL